eukprot:3425391-Rhodomonas_salina.3
MGCREDKDEADDGGCVVVVEGRCEDRKKRVMMKLAQAMMACNTRGFRPLVATRGRRPSDLRIERDRSVVRMCGER